jgi:hypothetical protein
MGLFYIKFILTNILFSLAGGIALVRFNKEGKDYKKFSNAELLLYSLGIGPVLTVLVLYFLMLFLPGRGDLFFLVSVLLVYAVLSILGRKSIAPLAAELKDYLSSSVTRFRGFKPLKKAEGILFTLLLAALLVVFLSLYLGNTLRTPLEGHDILTYGNIGKIYYQDKTISYSKNIFDEKSGFYFSGSPKPSFSLLLTWEMMLNRLFRSGGPGGGQTPDPAFDMYFRSISAYYGLLILALMVYWIYRGTRNKYLALLGILAMLSGLRFFLVLINYHLDSYRVFFLLLSWLFLAYSIKRRDGFSLFLLGMFSGFAAFIHVIGSAVAGLNCLTLFIFLEKPIKERAWKTAVVCLLVLLFGGIHYLLEALYGAQWGFMTYF